MGSSESSPDDSGDQRLRLRCLIADRSTIFALGLEAALTSDTVTVVGFAENQEEVREFVGRERVDVVIACFERPSEAIDVAASTGDCPVLVLSYTIGDRLLVDAARAGVRGVLAKDTSPEELLTAVSRIARGGTVIPPRWENPVPPPVESRPRPRLDQVLSRREEEVLQRVVQGYSNKQLARQLGIAEQTVKNHLRHIMAKLGVSSRVQLTRWALHPYTSVEVDTPVD